MKEVYAIIKTKIPGPRSAKVLKILQKKNGPRNSPYPFVYQSGSGCYVKDVDGNVFLDFGSQIATQPLGYNHPDLREVMREYAKMSPVKIAGQDFATREHAEMLEELTKIAPPGMNAAFVINSGAEAVENAMKICMRRRKATKIGISFEGAFHGRTLGALSATNSKVVQKRGFLSMNMRRLPFDEIAGEVLQKIAAREVSAEEIGFVILEHVQGEGGYNIASKKMVKSIRNVTQELGIPLIADEVQSGMGRTGKWWAFQHFGIKPEVMSVAKALQVGATIANKKWFPDEESAISSTWGGGHMLDLALGIQIIRTIKKRNLLRNAEKMGTYFHKGMQIMQEQLSHVQNVRGLGLMRAFDLPSRKMRDDVIIEAVKRGLILIGCGQRSVRVIPPLIIHQKEVDEGLAIIEESIRKCGVPRFRHAGAICAFMDCGQSST